MTADIYGALECARIYSELPTRTVLMYSNTRNDLNISFLQADSNGMSFKLTASDGRDVTVRMTEPVGVTHWNSVTVGFLLFILPFCHIKTFDVMMIYRLFLERCWWQRLLQPYLQVTMLDSKPKVYTQFAFEV